MATINTSNVTTDKYFYGVQGIAMTDTMYYIKNAHGDVIEVVDRGDDPLGGYIYEAFGTVIDEPIENAGPFKYCSEYYDDESGFIYLRNRYYDPSIGAFISEDPIQDGTNWYTYCGNNPVNFVDPTGLISIIFVSSNMSDQAMVRAEHYAEKYGTTSYVIKVDSSEQFVDKWNYFSEMARNQGETIDAIEIISHGSITGDIGLDSSGTANSTGYIYFTDTKKNKLYARSINSMKNGDYSVESLNYMEAKEININSCNSANKDTYNVVFGFMQHTKANSYSGFDGGAAWSSEKGDHISGGGSIVNDPPWYAFGDKLYYVKIYQSTWYKYVEKDSNGNPTRIREGRRFF